MPTLAERPHSHFRKVVVRANGVVQHRGVDGLVVDRMMGGEFDGSSGNTRRSVAQRHNEDGSGQGIEAGQCSDGRSADGGVSRADAGQRHAEVATVTGHHHIVPGRSGVGVRRFVG